MQVAVCGDCLPDEAPRVAVSRELQVGQGQTACDQYQRRCVRKTVILECEGEREYANSNLACLFTHALGVCSGR
jgi:hypothetical protein